MNPFIHKFETQAHKYLYDVNSNRIFRVSDPVYDLIEIFEGGGWRNLVRTNLQHSFWELVQAWKEIRQKRKSRKGFSSSRPVRLEFADGGNAENPVKDRPHEQLILNVTERCNLRCIYCTYSGRYGDHRQHGHRDMPWDTARMALDNFFRHSAERSFVSFYGGEPLLNLELIKRAVEYVNHLRHRPVNFALSTNGLLLSTETSHFLVQHNFNLQVSLDGPKDVHDRYRVDGRGHGSYDKVVANLKLLHSLNGDYFREKVSFSAVSAPPNRLRMIHEFFSGDPRWRNQTVNFSYVNPGLDSFAFNADSDERERERRDLAWLAGQYLEQVKRGDNADGFLRGLFEKDFARLHQRPRLALGKRIPLNGCCFPGARRLFVSVAGFLHVCEKMDHAYTLGMVADMVNPSKVEQLLEDYRTISSSCLTCWACRLCTVCFAMFGRNGRLDAEVRTQECAIIREDLHQRLVQYCRILEESPSAWDFLNNVILE